MTSSANANCIIQLDSASAGSISSIYHCTAVWITKNSLLYILRTTPFHISSSFKLTSGRCVAYAVRPLHIIILNSGLWHLIKLSIWLLLLYCIHLLIYSPLFWGRKASSTRLWNTTWTFGSVIINAATQTKTIAISNYFFFSYQKKQKNKLWKISKEWFYLTKNKA